RRRGRRPLRDQEHARRRCRRARLPAVRAGRELRTRGAARAACVRAVHAGGAARDAAAHRRPRGCDLDGAAGAGRGARRAAGAGVPRAARGDVRRPARPDTPRRRAQRLSARARDGGRAPRAARRADRQRRGQPASGRGARLQPRAPRRRGARRRARRVAREARSRRRSRAGALPRVARRRRGPRHAVHARPDPAVRPRSAGARGRARPRARRVRSVAGREGRARPAHDGPGGPVAAARPRSRSRAVSGVPPTVLIAGGGPVGLMLAALLTQGECAGRLRVRVLEPRPAPRWEAERLDLRVYALSRASQLAFERLGVWDEIRAKRASPYRAMRVWQGDDPFGFGAIAFDAADIGEPDLGHIVEDRLLRTVLIDLLERSPDCELDTTGALEGIEIGRYRVDVALA